MLYRHVQPMFMSMEYSDQPVRGPTMRVRPADTDAPDHLMQFLFWGSIKADPERRRVAAAPVTKPVDPNDPGKEPEVIVVTAPVRPKLLIEVSPDGEGWVVVSTLEVRDRPYLVTVPHMLQYVRVRLETSGIAVRGYALVMANTPFQLLGASPLVGGRPTRPRQPDPGVRR